MTKQNAYEFNNLTKSQQDCLSLIESLGIYELRALARVFGDNSPTTLKRNDHISIVMNKIISGEDLKPIPLRQGRPYKELSNIEGILAELSQITGKDYSLKSVQQRSSSHVQKAVTFRQVEDDVLKQKLFPIEVKGILCERNDKEYYFYNQYNGGFVLVKKSIDARLKPYDYVVGTAIIMNEEKEYILDSIKYINFQSYQNYKDNSNEYQQVVPDQKLKLNKAEIILGKRYLLQQSKFIDNADLFKNLLKKFNENKTITIGIVPNVMFEDKTLINSLGFNNLFTLDYNDRPLSVYQTMLLVVEHIKRLQQQGLSVALFVQDITTLANDIDFAFKTNTKALMGHTESAVDLIKQIMLLAKSGGENKNTTVFTTLDNSDLFDQMYVSAVYKVSNKIEL